MNPINAKKIRADFPILHQEINGHPLVYFDNAATTQKPSKMIDSLVEFYQKDNSNIHRGVHTLSQRATELFESTREYIAQLYNCNSREVIFTKNDTESLNLLAHCLPSLLPTNDYEVILSDLEHHSNIVPWQQLSDRPPHTATIRYASFTENGLIDIPHLIELISPKTQIISLNWCSNTFGVINPVKEIIQQIRAKKADIFIVLDGAQALPHTRMDFDQLDADFVTFSAHKLCGPTGVGVLIGKEQLLNKMPPFLGGGDMIREVSWETTTYNDLPYKFEAGTPNIADVVAFRASLEYLAQIGFDKILAHERELAEYMLNELALLPFITVYGPKTVEEFEKIALVSFNIQGIHAHDVGTLMDEVGIAVRSGHHCTQLIMKKLKIPASIRASLYIYNTREEIDLFIQRIKEIYALFQ